MRIAALLLACTLAPLVSAPAAAQTDSEMGYTKSDWSITASGFYVRPDEDRRTENHGAGADIAIGGRVVGMLFAEAHAFRAELETTGLGTDFYQSGGGLDLLLRFGNTETFDLFLLAGGGGVYNDVVPDSRDETSFFANVGIGGATPTTDLGGFRVRTDVRYVYDSYEYSNSRQDFDDVHWRVGLEFPLGRKRIETSREVIREVPVETIVEKVVEAPFIDSDGDGVPDNLDRCPNTLPGAQVAALGCVERSQVVILPNVNFEFDRADLTAQGRSVLDSATRFLAEQPELTVHVAGHTDWIGSQEYNENLSRKRAASVVSYLVSRGIAGNRLSSQGYGENEPIASNETDEGRARNRRVEFRITAAPR